MSKCDKFYQTDKRDISNIWRIAAFAFDNVARSLEQSPQFNFVDGAFKLVLALNLLRFAGKNKIVKIVTNNHDWKVTFVSIC